MLNAANPAKFLAFYKAGCHDGGKKRNNVRSLVAVVPSQSQVLGNRHQVLSVLRWFDTVYSGLYLAFSIGVLLTFP